MRTRVVFQVRLTLPPWVCARAPLTEHRRTQGVTVAIMVGTSTIVATQK
jgi:hypothetical protein